MNAENSTSPVDAEATRLRVLSAIAANRIPGFHLPGHFLGITWPRIEGHTIEQAIAGGPHSVDANGVVNPAVLGVMVDGALALAARLALVPGTNIATVSLNVQYTGHAARGAVTSEGTLRRFTVGDGVRQAISEAVVRSDGEEVCYATSTFVVLTPPPGMKIGTMPWQRGEAPPAPLKLKDLDATERATMRAAEAALRAADSQHAFIERFWGIVPRRTAGGAACRVPIGLQIGNRIGHVQGGITLGIAQATASAAVPDHPVVSNISAWYLRPGHGKALSVKSKVIHAGRSFAVVRTEVRNADRGLVLEAVSNHAALTANAKS